MTELDLNHSLISPELSEFISWLLDNDKVGNAASLTYFLEKPWKFTAEYGEFKSEQKREADRASKVTPCPYCGAESNIRCCEFGRDK